MTAKNDNKKMQPPNGDKKKNSDIQKKEELKENFFLNFMNRMNTEEVDEENDSDSHKNSNTSLNKIQYYALKIINKLNEQLDSILNSNRKIRWLSLAMAFGVFYIVNGGIGITKSKSYDVLANVPVEIIGEKDLYEIINVPDSVIINIYGDYIDVQSTKLKNKYYAYIDVSNLGEGTYPNVPLYAGNISKKLGWDIKPETVEITIAKKVVQTFDLKYEFKDARTNDIYTLHEPVLEFNTVKVRAAQQTIDKIDRVVALIDADITESKTNKIAKIVAYDVNNKIMDVEIIPKEVKYDITVTNYSKTVDLNVELTGNLGTNYGVKSLSYVPLKIDIYGIEEEIADIELLTVNYDISGLNESTDFKIPIKDLPKGVKGTSVNSVTGRIEIEPIISKEIKDIPIEIINNEGYKVTFAGDNNKASIKITGVVSKVSDFTSKDVQAYIDLKDVSEGTNEVLVQLIISDISLNWEWVTNEKISIIVKKE